MLRSAEYWPPIEIGAPTAKDRESQQRCTAQDDTISEMNFPQFYEQNSQNQGPEEDSSGE